MPSYAAHRLFWYTITHPRSGGLRAFVLALIALALSGVAAQAQSTAPRIVAVGGSVTEILYDLGLEQQIVGVDTTSVFPASALKNKPNVGYMRALSAEGVLSLNPTLVLLLDGSGPPDALKVLKSSGEASGLRIVTIPDAPSAAGVLAKIRAIGAATGHEDEAEQLAGEVERRFTLLDALRAKVSTPARALFVLGFQGGRPMVAGDGTTAAGILDLSGAVNAVSGFSGYKQITDEAIITSAPEVIVAMAHGGPSPVSGELFTRPAFSATPAAREQRLVTRDGQFLLGFGPRTPQAAADLLHALYPSLPIPDELAHNPAAP